MAGGAREGAGRKKGGRNRRRAKGADDLLIDAGVTPLAVMLEAMRASYESYQSSKEKADLHQAALYAKDAAPYCHPKLANVSVDLSGLTDEQLAGMVSGATAED
jgi:hypothetical protein